MTKIQLTNFKGEQIHEVDIKGDLPGVIIYGDRYFILDEGTKYKQTVACSVS